MTSATITFVGFHNTIRNITECEPKIVSIIIDNLSEDIVLCNECSYHGVLTDIPKDTFMPFAGILEEKIDIDTEFKEYCTVCMLINDTVLFMDLFSNSDDFTAHPLYMIGVATTIRDKLNKAFPTKNLKYLSQSPEWFEKQEEYHKNHEESIARIKFQLELLKSLSPH
jgi:hypothetical protein